jgi:putative ABC transport system permease protein
MTATAAFVPVGAADLIGVGALLAINALISLTLRLGLEKTLALAVVRMALQLAALGYALKFVAAAGSPVWTAALALAMLAAASHTLMEQRTYRLAGWWSEGLCLSALTVVGGLASLLAVAALAQPDAWTPAQALAVLGLVLGHLATAVALVVDRLSNDVLQQRNAIEARLALGRSRFGALLPQLRVAMRAAMMPVIAGMAGAGMAGVPEVMAGHILAGADPLAAALLQVQILLLVGAAVTAAVLMAGLGGVVLLTDARHRLRLDRLEQRRSA